MKLKEQEIVEDMSKCNLGKRNNNHVVKPGSPVGESHFFNSSFYLCLLSLKFIYSFLFDLIAIFLIRNFKKYKIKK